MIDIHSHVLFDVDDGAKSIEESIYMLKEAEMAGFTDILLTPHYIEGIYADNQEEIISKFEELKEKIQEQGLGIQIHLGNEIYVVPDISEKIAESKVFTLGNSKHVLVETHLTTNILYLEHEIDRMIENGYVPILAHPERYESVKSNIKSLDKFINKGVLLQSNYGSIAGYHGSMAEKVVKKLLKSQAISFLASDNHYTNSIYAAIPSIKKELQRMIPRDYYYDITEYNARQIIY